jgi:hypothetical protein
VAGVVTTGTVVVVLAPPAVEVPPVAVATEPLGAVAGAAVD